MKSDWISGYFRSAMNKFILQSRLIQSSQLCRSFWACTSWLGDNFQIYMHTRWKEIDLGSYYSSLTWFLDPSIFKLKCDFSNFYSCLVVTKVSCSPRTWQVPSTIQNPAQEPRTHIVPNLYIIYKDDQQIYLRETFVYNLPLSLIPWSAVNT